MENDSRMDIYTEKQERDISEEHKEGISEELKEDISKEDGRVFVIGMLSGILLVFIFIGVFLLWYQFRPVVRDREMPEEAQTEERLELSGDAILDKITLLEDVINENYIGEIDGAKVEDAVYKGLIDGLDDPYSVYFTADEVKELEESVNGEYSGIGVLISQDPDDGSLEIISCFDNTPASEAGLMPGDLVISINGESAQEMSLDTLVAKIRNSEDKKVDLGLLRDGEELNKILELRPVEVPTVESSMKEDGIGYIRILEFDQVTVDQFQDALEDLKSQGMDKLIIDLRDNPGGLLNVVCDILDAILPEAMIVYTEDKYGNTEEYYSDEEHKLEMPLAVLINENSASASEIFAGAVRDHGWGTLIGETTFGKGIVQRTFMFSDGSGIKLTVEKYYTPNGTDIHEKGIEPDVAVELKTEAGVMIEAGSEDDTQFQRAAELLKGEDQ